MPEGDDAPAAATDGDDDDAVGATEGEEDALALGLLLLPPVAFHSAPATNPYMSRGSGGLEPNREMLGPPLKPPPPPVKLLVLPPAPLPLSFLGRVVEEPAASCC